MDQQISLRMGGELASLHGLGWISTDLHQLIELADLLEAGNQETVERYFGVQARPFNRYKTFPDAKHRAPSQISLHDDGTLELVISGLGIAAAIIMPLVQFSVARRLNGQAEAGSFTLTPKDPGLKRVMQAFDRGDFGDGADALHTLAFVLKELNYDAPFLVPGAEVIEHSIDRYARRIARTIRKNLR